MSKENKSVRVSVKKPTVHDVMLHRFLNFGKSSGIEPIFPVQYKRRKPNEKV